MLMLATTCVLMVLLFAEVFFSLRAREVFRGFRARDLSSASTCKNRHSQRHGPDFLAHKRLSELRPSSFSFFILAEVVPGRGGRASSLPEFVVCTVPAPQRQLCARCRITHRPRQRPVLGSPRRRVADRRG